MIDLIKDGGSDTNIEKVCLLDPKAEQELSPDDGDGRFEYFLFGVRSSLSLRVYTAN
jgi:ribosome biogenesis SPOUT family RNA methylase Rps3